MDCKTKISIFNWVTIERWQADFGRNVGFLLLLLLFLLIGHFASGHSSAGVGGDRQRLDSFGGEFAGDRLEFFAVHRDFDRFLGAAAIQALVGGDVGEVAPDRDLHEISPDNAAIGGIKSDPAG